MILKRASESAEPALPAWKAFVVQFSREADGTAQFCGRVEHLQSGRRARFTSAEELTAAIRRLLQEQGGPSGEGSRS
ncbi:hypothetical protein KF840_25760 [bacterium]|nr:hypothetical protein [bacterium]